ncbi:MAG: hypothetical protein KGJ60_00235 [Verrucomicrobiota bacterium]|nr:hypothetical protein [Verrucomicrobiota bacterium]
MSEFKFACPVCGQHIRCDSSQSGSAMGCPTCFQKIIAPNAPATDASKYILTGTKAGERPSLKMAGQGPAPGPVSRGVPGAVVVVVLLLGIAAAVAFVYHGTLFKPAPAGDVKWTLNLGAMTIPDAPAAGRIHGTDFTCRRAVLEGGGLTLRQGGHGVPDLSVTIYLHAKRSAVLAGQNIRIAANFADAPPVRLRCKEIPPQMKTETFEGGYALRLEFGALAGKRLPGRIYLSTPDPMKSYVAGTFNAEIRQPKPKRP